MQRPALPRRRVALRDRFHSTRDAANAPFVAPARADPLFRKRARHSPGRRGGVRQAVPRIQPGARRARRAARARPAPRRRAHDGHAGDRPRSDGRRLEHRARGGAADRGAQGHRRHGRTLRPEIGQRRRRAFDPREARPHDSPDVSRADSPDRARVALHLAGGPLPARDDHGPQHRTERVGNGRLSVHAPRIQRALGPRRVARRGADERGRRRPGTPHGALEPARREGLAGSARVRDRARSSAPCARSCRTAWPARSASRRASSRPDRSRSCGARSGFASSKRSSAASCPGPGTRATRRRRSPGAA